MAMFHKESRPCGTCSFVGWVVAILLFLTTVASFVGVYKSHFLEGGMTFGTTNGSLALLAFIVSVTLCGKMMHVCCGCACSTKK